MALEQTENLAKQIAQKLKPGSVLALYGELGSGKTTFTRFLTKALKSSERVQSPTFVIARRYRVENGKKSGISTIHHLDLYRLKTAQEVKDLDLGQFISDPSAITIIEWPEFADERLPKDSIKIKFEYVDDTTRKIYVQDIY